MKKILFLITLFSVTTSAQILDPVSWSFSHKKITNNEYELYFKAQIQDGWHLYSQHMPEGADAFPTTFVFEKNDAYELLEGVQEPEPIKDFDPNYDMILPYFEEEVVFIQRIKVMSSDLIDLEGEISFMCCDESQCVFPPEVSFLFQVDGVEGVFFGSDFITITKNHSVDWQVMKPLILGSIMDHYNSNEETINKDPTKENNSLQSNENDSDIVKQIKELLDTRVRPAVAMDGGDIIYDSFKDGVVYLHMQGACSGCPSSTATLKMGIENMLKHYVPEVQEVRPVDA